MVGPTDVVQPPVPRAARARDAWLCHVSSVGGARRRGCAAAGAPVFVNRLPGARRRERERERAGVHAGAQRVAGADLLPEVMPTASLETGAGPRRPGELDLQRPRQAERPVESGGPGPRPTASRRPRSRSRSRSSTPRRCARRPAGTHRSRRSRQSATASAARFRRPRRKRRSRPSPASAPRPRRARAGRSGSRPSRPGSTGRPGSASGRSSCSARCRAGPGRARGSCAVRPPHR